MTNSLRLVAVVLALAGVGVTGCTGPQGEPSRGNGSTAIPPSSAPATSAPPTPALETPMTDPATAFPRSMAALGDSMTRAFAACPGAGDCPASSWSTGSEPGLASHAQRIAERSDRSPQVHNVAVSGATVAGLRSQVSAAVAADVDYVTILIGANDACAPSGDAMTSVARFRAEFTAALEELVEGLPKARIFVSSIPDLRRLWAVGKDVDEVVKIWEQYGICQSMLGNPRVDGSSARARRDRVRDRVLAYNRVMEQACSQHRTCRSDGGAVFGYEFSLAMVSRADYWHPSIRGQQALAEVSWRAGFWG